MENKQDEGDILLEIWLENDKNEKNKLIYYHNFGWKPTIL